MLVLMWGRRLSHKRHHKNACSPPHPKRPNAHNLPFFFFHTRFTFILYCSTFFKPLQTYRVHQHQRPPLGLHPPVSAPQPSAHCVHTHSHTRIPNETWKASTFESRVIRFVLPRRPQPSTSSIIEINKKEKQRFIPLFLLAWSELEWEPPDDKDEKDDDERGRRVEPPPFFASWRERRSQVTGTSRASSRIR